MARVEPLRPDKAKAPAVVAGLERKFEASFTTAYIGSGSPDLILESKPTFSPPTRIEGYPQPCFEPQK